MATYLDIFQKTRYNTHLFHLYTVFDHFCEYWSLILSPINSERNKFAIDCESQIKRTPQLSRIFETRFNH